MTYCLWPIIIPLINKKPTIGHHIINHGGHNLKITLATIHLLESLTNLVASSYLLETLTDLLESLTDAYPLKKNFPLRGASFVRELTWQIKYAYAYSNWCDCDLKLVYTVSRHFATLHFATTPLFLSVWVLGRVSWGLLVYDLCFGVCSLGTLG